MIVATVLAGGIGVVSARAVATELADGRLVELPVPALDLHRPLQALWTGHTPSEPAYELVSIARSDNPQTTRLRRI